MVMAAEETGIGDRIQSLRKAAGMTQRQLAEAAGMTLSSLTQIEQGIVKDPRLSTLLSLAKVFQVSLDYLAHGEGEATS